MTDLLLGREKLKKGVWHCAMSKVYEPNLRPTLYLSLQQNGQFARETGELRDKRQTTQPQNQPARRNRYPMTGIETKASGVKGAVDPS